jgi:hypothetical protein
MPVVIPFKQKKAFATIPWDKSALPHKVWYRCTHPIPLKTNTIDHDGQCKINLKIVTSTMVIQILLPLFLPNICILPNNTKLVCFDLGPRLVEGAGRVLLNHTIWVKKILDVWGQ